MDYKEFIYNKTNIYYTIYQAITGSRITVLIKIVSSFFLKEPRNLIFQAIIGSRTTILTIIFIIVKNYPFKASDYYGKSWNPTQAITGSRTTVKNFPFSLRHTEKTTYIHNRARH
jgi:hypothetical protein